MPGEDRVLDRGHDRVLVADDAGEDLRPRGQAGEEVGPQLVLDRPRAPARGAELARGSLSGIGTFVGIHGCSPAVLGSDSEPKRRPAERQTGPSDGTPGWPRGPPRRSVVPAATRDARWSRRRSTSISKSPAARPDPARQLRSDRPSRNARMRPPPGPRSRGPPARGAGRDRGCRGRRAGRSARPPRAGGHRRGGAGRPRRPRCDSSSSASRTGGRRSAVEDVVERVGVDRRRQAVADRGRPDRDPGGRRPRCRRACGRTARGRAGRWSRAGPAGPVGGGRTRDARPAELGRLWQPVERLALAGQLDQPRRPAAGTRAAPSSRVVLPTC